MQSKNVKFLVKVKPYVFVKFKLMPEYKIRLDYTLEITTKLDQIVKCKDNLWIRDA